ncbi:Mismatch repair endonuclease PMS2 [Nymphon striatum]|nr:Mismatch repair endonuclease PMS2 [Nymphon striatum]
MIFHSTQPQEITEMSGTVKAIDKTSVHKICSGQVILTLSTAVKELVENSLDAGATNVDVRLKGFGEESIEVSDNGSGIESYNFNSIALKHHTSKLKEFSDLIDVSTFGFRGEALSSLSALCDFSITTRHQSCENGTKLNYDHNGEISNEIGTTVTLKNLFKTLPVRHKEFSVHNFSKKTVVVNTNGNQDLLGSIANIFSHQQTKSIKALKQLKPSAQVLEEYDILEDHVTAAFSITGYISVCEHGQGRSSSDRQFYFINKRPCDNSKLSRIVNEVYHQYNRHQYPFVFLDITFQKESVDVNVTPDKRQIFIQNEKMLLATIKTQIKTTSLSSAFKIKTACSDPPSSSQISFNKLKRAFSHGVINPAIFKSPIQTKLNMFTLNKTPDSSFNEEDGCTDGKDERLTKRPKFDFQTNSFFSDMVSEADPLKDSFSSISDSEDLNNMKSTVESKSDFKIHTYEHSLPDRLKEDFDEHTVPNKLNEKLNRSDVTEKFQEIDPISNISYCDKPKEGNFEKNQSAGDKNENSLDVDEVTEVDEIEEVCKKSVTIPFNFSKIASFCELREANLEDLKTMESSRFKAKITPEDNKKAEDELKKAIGKEMFCKMEILCQFNLGFIIAKLNSDLFIIDQHASDEKYNFEFLQKNETLQNQKLIQLDKVFSEFGIPNVLKTDNGPPFNGYEFKDYAEHTGFKHRKITPLWPRANAEAERFMRTLKKSIKGSLISQRTNWKQEMYKFLLAYRTTPHSSTGVPPATALFQRNIKNRLPCIDYQPKLCDSKMRKKDADAKQKMKNYADNKVYVKPNQFKEGDAVLLKDVSLRKSKTPYEPIPYTVTATKEFKDFVIPMPLNLTMVNESILKENLEIFKKNGFECEFDENEKASVISIPVCKNWTFGKEDIDELIFMLSDSPGVMCRPSRVQKMFASQSCRKSVMIGTGLNIANMEKLVLHMGEIEQPWNCPHGRPTIRHLINLDMVHSTSN